MEYIAYAAVIWVGLALTFWIALIIMENVLAAVRGPEYIQVVTDAAEKAEGGSPDTLTSKIIHWLWSWPTTFWHWVQAARQGKTLMEYAKDHNDAVHEFRQSFAASIDRANSQLSQALGDSTNRIWLSFGFPLPDGNSVGAFLRLTAFDSDLVATHLVMENADGTDDYFILRMGVSFSGVGVPDPTSVLPDINAKSLRESVSRCEGDDAWNALCGPETNETERDEFRSTHRENP